VNGGSDALSVDVDLATAVGLVNATDELDERGLTRAVLSDERVNFAWLKNEVCVIEDGHTGEGGRQVSNF
jgi:hypothetical protein